LALTLRGGKKDNSLKTSQQQAYSHQVWNYNSVSLGGVKITNWNFKLVWVGDASAHRSMKVTPSTEGDQDLEKRLDQKELA
jgi:hypothetical protein